MKRFILILVCLTLLCAVANADTIDLSGMTYDELVELVDEAQKMIMFSDYWQEVEVPQGEYVIGEEIPEGKWVITAFPTNVPIIEQFRKQTVSNMYGTGEVEEYRSIYAEGLYGVETDHYTERNPSFVTLELMNGDLLKIRQGTVIFTPYKGLGFKFK